MILPYKIEIEYGEIYVFPQELGAPCHDWTEDYTAQGFCWLETQVAFLTLREKGLCSVTVESADEIKIRPDAIRAIQVPFGLDEDSDVVVSASSFSPTCAIPKGEYCLIFQTGLQHQKHPGYKWEEMWCSFTFIRCDDEVEAKILRQDKHLKPPKRLYTRNESEKPLIRLGLYQWPFPSYGEIRRNKRMK